MNIKSTSWIALAVLHIGIAGNAQAATVFTDSALFEAALNPNTVILETFEDGSYDTVDTPDKDLFLNPTGRSSQTLNHFSIESDPAAIKIFSGEHVNSHNTTNGGNQFLYLDTDLGLQGVITADFLLNESADAFGFYYTGVHEPGTDFTVTIGSDTFILNSNPGTILPDGTVTNTSPLFWGVMGLGNFDKITLFTSLDSAYGVDDVIFGSAIPLPPAIWLFGSGLMALAGGAVKRKPRS